MADYEFQSWVAKTLITKQKSAEPHIRVKISRNRSVHINCYFVTTGCACCAHTA